METPPQVVLTIAGSDCSAGAGIQADLKTFQHFRLHGLTAITCVVSETANVVQRVHPVPVEVVADQVSLLLESFPVAAIKTGMLFSADHVRAIAKILTTWKTVPLVVDPVMVASTGTALVEDDAIETYRDQLLPIATLITPNLPEAETLLESSIRESNLREAAVELAATFRAAVLLKGGHIGGSQCIDVLAKPSGEVREFSAPRLSVQASHGTGCTLSAAIAARLACGDLLGDAVACAKTFLGETLSRSYAFQGSNEEGLAALNQGTCWPS
jgi:hydroxymethylpyrimidine/phosphomethylpyrimidine kinase